MIQVILVNSFKALSDNTQCTFFCLLKLLDCETLLLKVVCRIFDRNQFILVHTKEFRRSALCLLLCSSITFLFVKKCFHYQQRQHKNEQHQQRITLNDKNNDNSSIRTTLAVGTYSFLIPSNNVQ